jgi:hypothetical protein
MTSRNKRGIAIYGQLFQVNSSSLSPTQCYK